MLIVITHTKAVKKSRRIGFASALEIDTGRRWMPHIYRGPDLVGRSNFVTVPQGIFKCLQALRSTPPLRSASVRTLHA
jgi:hypothetical protein